MITKGKFTHMTVAEFKTWLDRTRIARTVLYIQEHHTYSPNYSLFTGSNHFGLQTGMRNTHVNKNGWSDIGQHFTIFPDGTVMTGRNIEQSPACIYMRNAHSVCIESVGNFDSGGDAMTPEQRDAIVEVTAALCKKFSVPVNTDKVVYHHWYKLSDGTRNDGAGGNKSCPGTNFFGGNKVADAAANFLPLVSAAMQGAVPPPPANILKYVAVSASSLNVRKQANASADKVTDREPARFGAILRVYKVQNGWYKISSSKQHWVNGSLTTEVVRATVNTDSLNVRNAPMASAIKLDAVAKNEEVFIYETVDGWSRINVDERWVKDEFLTRA